MNDEYTSIEAMTAEDRKRRQVSEFPDGARAQLLEAVTHLANLPEDTRAAIRTVAQWLVSAPSDQLLSNPELASEPHRIAHLQGLVRGINDITEELTSLNAILETKAALLPANTEE